ncbi:uncharacterized protein Dvir_GJ27082 [Drosophila virilis]|uniref:Rhodanese domain-containing protein n=1 Tax=Drosophila virilis TaxID=7244 RepID=A0A0Q9W056_DROVI|nr:rhodanese domain-containing protein CG4456 isoform X2 [Drosophila virilis]KRF78365.1 uncharacterized protein Dvir_GJ27082 [Drosophila virilis]
MLTSIFCRVKRQIPLNQGIKGAYLAYCAYCNKAPIIDKSSLNIPADHLPKALGPATSEAEFKLQFGREKPLENTELMFSCATGKLARLSAVQAVALGYRYVCFYDGSCADLLQQDKKMNIA